MLSNMSLLILTKEDCSADEFTWQIILKGENSTIIKQNKYYWHLDLNKVIDFSRPPQLAQALVA